MALYSWELAVKETLVIMMIFIINTIIDLCFY